MTPQEELGQFIEQTVKMLCKHPEKVDIQTQGSSGGMIFFIVRCAPDDVGSIVGNGGRNIKALKALAWAKAVRHQFMSEVIVAT